MMNGEQLRAARRRAGYTQAQAAAVLGVSQSHVCNIEAGRVRVDDLTLARCVALYRVTVQTPTTPDAVTLYRAELARRGVA